MKQVLFTLASMAMFFSAEAAVWRVNNIAGVNANFTNLSTAVTSASSGDTIYVEPSATGYSGASLTKKLTIIGNGYFTTAAGGYLYTYNSGLQADMTTSTVADISFGAGSENSTIMGLRINGSVYIGASNINVKRNYIVGYVYLGNLQGSSYVNISNIDIRQNLIQNGITTYQFSTNSGAVTMTNLNIQNNILTLYTYMLLQLPVGISGFFMNNVLYNPYYAVDLYGFQVNNNVSITSSTTFNANNNVIFNNVSGGTVFGNANGNLQNISMATLFLNYNSGSADSSYMINPSGPGATAGFGGVAVGPYGGPDPYRKSGIPPIPAIYQLSAPATTTTTTLPVTISTRSND